MANSFFAMHSRMKYINRWALMRNTASENISQHSNDVAAIAHALAVMKNIRFGGSVNAERAAFLGLYHDMPEETFFLTRTPRVRPYILNLSMKRQVKRAMTNSTLTA